MGFKERIYVMILCGGSATDLPEQGPAFARHFNTVDSYDTHAKIPEYFEHVNAEAAAGGNVSVISTGWDPGLFSLNRLLDRKSTRLNSSHVAISYAVFCLK